MVGDDGRQYRWVSCKGAWLPRISNTPHNADYNTNVRPFGWLSTCMHVWFSSFSFFFLLFLSLSLSPTLSHFFIFAFECIWTRDGRARRVRTKVDVVTKNRKRNGYSMTTQIQYVRILHGGWRLGTTHSTHAHVRCSTKCPYMDWCDWWEESKWQE